MSLLINHKNVDDLIFMDKKLKDQLPEFNDLFNQWFIGKRMPSLRFLSQKASLSLLEKIEGRHLSILSKYFNEEVSVEPIDYHVARTHKVPVDDLEGFLNGMKGFSQNFSLSRDKDHAYISFWR